MVRKARLELARVTPPASKAGASTNSATFARAAPAPLSTLEGEPPRVAVLAVRSGRRIIAAITGGGAPEVRGVASLT